MQLRQMSVKPATSAPRSRRPGRASSRSGRGPRMRSADRREQLLDVTRDLAWERGFHAVSIDAVARAAGITRPVVYGHFGDLSGLLHAVVDREGERATSQLAALLPADLGPDPRQQLMGALRAFLEAVQAEPVRWGLILMPPQGAPEIMRERFERERAAVTAQLAVVVGPPLTAVPADPAPDAELLARSLQAIAEELARVMLADPGRYPLERVLDYARWALQAFDGPR
jgi:AcrR family transcriptional regulator